MAGQLHAVEARATAAPSTGSSPTISRAARSTAAARRSRPSTSCAPCRASKIPTSSICRRSSASARRGASSAAISSRARTCSAARRSTIRSASMAGRWRRMSRATSSSSFRRSRNRAAYNELPYRMLVPEGIDNLLVAGRCASMTHEGQSAARVSGACFAMGEAAGTAAALALSGNTVPRDIAIEKLQQALEAAGRLHRARPGGARRAVVEDGGSG